MPVPFIRGESVTSWYQPDPAAGPPPVAGDLIIMKVPEDEPVPHGWTDAGPYQDGVRACWRLATGHERAFPFPATWYGGVVRPDGTADQRGTTAP